MEAGILSTGQSQVPVRSSVKLPSSRAAPACFLSYVLVEHLSGAQPTVLQIGSDSDEYSHILFDKSGIRPVLPNNDDSLRDSATWAPADQKPRDLASPFDCHNWLVVLTSQPRRENYKWVERGIRCRRWALSRMLLVWSTSILSAIMFPWSTREACNGYCNTWWLLWRLAMSRRRARIARPPLILYNATVLREHDFAGYRGNSIENTVWKGKCQ